MTPEHKWLPGRQAAEYFAVPYKTLLSLASRGRLPSGAVIRIGRQVRFNITMIEAGAALRKK